MLGALKLETTRLVIFSACNSAGGHPIGPEGLAALARPVIAAGSPAVMGSLWKVESRATEELLVRFHRYYAGGEDAARALRHAQLDLMKDPVLFWAPFQLTGHAGPPLSRDHPRRDSP
jgi:CHAT domain-containing protein